METTYRTCLVATIVLLASLSSVRAGSEAEEIKVIVERNVPVPMRDGTILRADVHRPDRGGPYPVLVQRTPYGKDSKVGTGGNFDAFVKAGYIVVSQDVRGRYESGGEWESFRRFETHDAEDGYDTIEWAARLPGSTGKVGTFGISYLALLQWRLAPLQPPSLAAMSACGCPDPREELAEGVLRPRRLFGALTIHSPETRRRADRPGVHRRWEAGRLWDKGDAKKWTDWLPWLELPREVFEDETETIKYLLMNPYVDPLRLDVGCREILVPNLEITGWFDFGNNNMLFHNTMVIEGGSQATRKGSRIIIGPWAHGYYGRSTGRIDFGPDAKIYLVSEQTRWFDYWLKDKQNGVNNDAPVRIFVMGDNKWRDEERWPLQRTRDKVLFIASEGQANTPSGDGNLIGEKPGRIVTDRYVYDPNNPVPSLISLKQHMWPVDQRGLANRKDILVYQSEPLKERLEITGFPAVNLYAKSSAPDTDWLVRLIDVYPNGLALDVSHGLLRARYRNGMEKPELITSEDVIRYTIRMRPTSNAFLPGHRIRLDITSSDFPNYDRNHNTPVNQNADATLETADQTVYHGGEYATRIILPWIPNPAEEENFEAPLEKQEYPLSKAAADGNIKQLELLISRGVDINVKDETGMAPLDYAAETGKKEVVQFLIQAGADVNAKDDSGVASLYLAASANRREMVELLIAEGADIDVKDVRGRTALIGVVSRGRRDIAELLIQKGAGIDAKSNLGLNSLHTSAVQGYQNITDLLLTKGAKVDERDDNYEFTALHYAARFGTAKVAEVLIAHGADIKAKDKWSYQPIHWAAYHDQPEIIELLIAKGSDVNVKTSLGQTPLELAKPRRNTASIEVLLKHGARE